MLPQSPIDLFPNTPIFFKLFSTFRSAIPTALAWEGWSKNLLLPEKSEQQSIKLKPPFCAITARFGHFFYPFKPLRASHRWNQRPPHHYPSTEIIIITTTMMGIWILLRQALPVMPQQCKSTALFSKVQTNKISYYFKHNPREDWPVGRYSSLYHREPPGSSPPASLCTFPRAARATLPLWFRNLKIGIKQLKTHLSPVVSQ